MTSVAVALQVEEADTAVEVKEELVGVGERDADKAKILVMEKQLKKTGDLMASLHAKVTLRYLYDTVTSRSNMKTGMDVNGR